MATLGENIKAARKAKGMSQVLLSQKSGVPQSVISDLERGEAKSTGALVELAKALGLTAEELKKGTTSQIESSSIQFKKIDIAEFKKKYNITDNDESVLFSKLAQAPIILNKRWVPVKAYSKMGMDGYFTDMGYDGNGGDGYVPTHSAGPKAFGIRGTGDSMFPAIRNGWFVVCDPDAEPVPTEFVQVCLKDGRCTIKEFVGINGGVLNLIAVNGGERLSFDMDDVESITAITDIVPPSQHKQDHPNSY